MHLVDKTFCGLGEILTQGFEVNWVYHLWQPITSFLARLCSTWFQFFYGFIQTGRWNTIIEDLCAMLLCCSFSFRSLATVHSQQLQRIRDKGRFQHIWFLANDMVIQFRFIYVLPQKQFNDKLFFMLYWFQVPFSCRKSNLICGWTCSKNLPKAKLTKKVTKMTIKLRLYNKNCKIGGFNSNAGDQCW